MSKQFDMKDLLDLRKLTNVIAEILEEQLKGYLATLQPLFLPQTILGNNTRPGTTSTVKGADRAFAELSETYEKLAGTRLYNLPRELPSPIYITTARPEIGRVQYPYQATDDGNTKSLVAVSPLKWVLSYAGFTPHRLRELLAQGSNVNERDLRETVLHILVTNLVVKRKPDLVSLFSALGYSLRTGKLQDLGDISLTFINAPIKTTRAPDPIMLQIAEVSGSPVFEEVISIRDIIEMKTPLKDRLIQEAQTHAGHLFDTVGTGHTADSEEVVVPS